MSVRNVSVEVDVASVAEVFGELTDEQRWVCWRAEDRGGRPTKVPYQPDGRRASSTDPTTWSTLHDAVQAHVREGYSGIGIVLGRGLGGVDLDACRNPETGEIAGWARGAIEEFHSYTEISPSGTGVKILARGAPAALPASVLPMSGEPINGKRPALEAYVSGRYFALTGEAVNGGGIADAGEAWGRLSAKLAEHAMRNGGGARRERKPTGSTEIPEELWPALEDETTAAGRLWRGEKDGGDKSGSGLDASLAATLGAMGFPDKAIEAALRSYRHGQVSATQDDRQVARLLGIAARRRRERSEDHGLTHDSLALKLGEGWPDARYVAKWGRWLFWDEARWATDETRLHMTRCRGFLRHKAEEVAEWAERKAEGLDAKAAEDLRKWAQREGDKLRSAYTVVQVIGLARSNETQAANVGQWDRDPMLLGTPGGTVDLRTGELRDPRPHDYIMKATAVEPAPPGTPTPIWDTFLRRIMAEDKNNDKDLSGYLRRFAGYALTGSIEEHAFVFGYGTGANGKGVFTGTVQGVLGDYANTVPTEMLMVTRNERHPTELARLGGVRLAIGSETEVGRTWAQGRIKSLTGGDRIAARFMRQDFFEFDPTFKLFIVGNRKPSLRGVDEGIRRRLHLVPFIVKIPAAEQDPKLPEKLRAEWPGILRWAIDGCLEWQERGLDPPGAVLAATDEYLAGEDAVGRWLEERVTENPQRWASSADLYESWRQWAETGGEFVISKKRLSQELQDRGFEPLTRSNQRGYRGLMPEPGGGPGS